MAETGPLFASSGDLIADRRYNAAMDLAARGDLAAATDVLAQTVVAAPGFTAAWFALGALRGRLGDREGAIAAFTEASRADPDDCHGARLQLARLGVGETASAMSESYLRRLFDQYAARYDVALTEQLHYRGPAILCDTVRSVLYGLGRPMRFEALLDLGCGSGLAGAAFRPFAAHLVGVDLSPAMAARAQAKDLYDRLVVGNFSEVLAGEIAHGAQYDLVLAADVFVYVADLTPVFAEVASVLMPGGIVAFTVETHESDAHESHAHESHASIEVSPTLRFAHSAPYLHSAIAAAGLKLIAMDKAAIRTEKAAPVTGLVVVAGLVEPR
jgi:predicted TPR repeat methyltransferase